MKLLVTGGAGFIGNNFIRHILKKHPDCEVLNLDKLTYAGNLDNLKDVSSISRYSFLRGDIADRGILHDILSQRFDIIVNFAAESHVDRSILDSSPFLQTNVQGTQALLDGIREYPVKLFIQVSTDEVYGSIDGDRKSTEESSLLPNSPYAASKAAADLLCRAYHQTYGLPIIITRCSNNYGPFQFPEKLIPLVVTNALEDKEIPVYGDGLNVRDWIHVEDHCRAIDCVIQAGRPGEIYNIGADNQRANLELVRKILGIMRKPEDLVRFVSDRPGHDRQYALETSKIIRELGWKPIHSFDEALEDTVIWYTQNEEWWRQVKDGDYLQYYERMYTGR